jgi:UPF0755 protein
MSRDRYEGWDAESRHPDQDAHDPRGRRRSHRAAAADQGRIADSAPSDRPARQGSHRRGGDYAGGADTGPGQAGGYRPAADAYDDAGYGGSRGGYGGSSYGAGHQDAGYDDGYARPGQAGSGGYDRDDYGQPGYRQADSYGRDSDYGRYSDGSTQPGYAGESYQNGYRDGGYPDNDYRDDGYGPSGQGGRAEPDSFAGGAAFPGPDDPYGAPDPYGPTDPYRRSSQGHTDPRGQADPFGRDRSAYGGADGYGERYGGQDAYGGQDSYRTSSAGSEYGGGYDEHDYGSAARGRDSRPRYSAGGTDYGDRRGLVDDTGLSRRRVDHEDELDPDSARHNGFFRGFGAADDDFGHRPPKRRRSKAGLVALLVLVLFVGGIAGAGVYGYKWYTKRHADWTGSKGTGAILVSVRPNEIACGPLATRLAADGVVASASAFCSAAKASGLSSSLQPGTFRMRKHMGAAEAWALIISPKARVQSKVVVPDGLRVSKVIARLSAQTGIPVSQFETALKSPALGLPSWAKGGNPEGFLWPATYSFPPGTSALSMLQTMVKQFNTEVASVNLAAKARAAHFSEYEVIIEASLLEGEVGPQYYARVARVIDNRLNQNPPWKLGLDSTVAYALNKYVYNLTKSDLNTNSPYNTTRFPGLPPGPIDSPDLAAIEAVLHPAPNTGDMYFVTVDKKGTTLFTSSASQFNAWAQEAIRNGV